VASKDANKQSLRDRELLEAAANGATGLDMEDRFGIPAAEAVFRVKQLLNSQNAFDEIEQRQLSILTLKKLRSDIEKAGVDVENPKHIEAYTKLTLAMDRILGNMSTLNEAQLSIVTESNAKAMLRMIEKAYGRARDLLKTEYGDFIDIKLINDAFAEGLRQAAEDE
jgi:hypothetical protein